MTTTSSARRLAVVGSLLAGLLAAGCSSPTDPVDLVVVGRTVGSGPERMTLTGASRSIVIEGVFVTPTACWDLAPRLDAQGQELELMLVADEQTGACGPAETELAYRVRITDLVPGVYHVTVIHRLDLPGRGDTHFQGVVQANP